MKSQEQGQKKVVFRRIGGRVVPITVGSTGAAGAVAALDAARTTQIYAKKGITITKKRFAVQPFVWDKLGTKLTMYNRVGKKVASASYYRGATDSAKSFGFSWIGVKKAYRGKGYSKVLSGVAAGDIRKQGGTHLFNHVIHEGSLKTNYNRVRDTLWKLQDVPLKKSKPVGILDRARKFAKDLRHGSEGGLHYVKKVGLAEAEKNIKWHRARWIKPTNAIERVMQKAMPWTKVTSHSNIFRQTSLKGVPYRKLIETRTFKNKATIALGTGAAVGALAYFALRRKKNDRKK